MRSFGGLLLIGLMSVAGCKTGDGGSTLQSGKMSPESSDPQGGADIASSIVFENDQVVVRRCSTAEVSRGQSRATASTCDRIVSQMSVQSFLQKVRGAYLQHHGRSSLTPAEEKIAVMVASYLQVQAGQGEQTAEQLFAGAAADQQVMEQLKQVFGEDMIRKYGYRGVAAFVMQELRGLAPIALGINDQETPAQRSKLGLQDQGLQFVHEFYAPYGAQTATAIYQLPEAYRVRRLKVQMSDHRGYACGAVPTALNIWRQGEARGGPLRHIGNSIYESHHAGRVLNIDRLQVVMSQVTYSYGYCKLEITSIGDDGGGNGGGGSAQRPRFPRDTVAKYTWVETSCSQDMGCAEYGAPGDYGCEAQRVDWSNNGEVAERVGSWEGGNNECETLRLKSMMCQRGVDLSQNHEWQVRCFSKEYPQDVPAGAQRTGEVQTAAERFQTCEGMRGCAQYARLGALGCEGIGPGGVRFTSFDGSNNSCDALAVFEKICVANSDRLNQFRIQCYDDPNATWD